VEHNYSATNETEMRNFSSVLRSLLYRIRQVLVFVPGSAVVFVYLTFYDSVSFSVVIDFSRNTGSLHEFHSKIKPPFRVMLYLTKTGVERILVIFQPRPMLSPINGKLSPRPFE